jgi:hypothetical protein
MLQGALDQVSKRSTVFLRTWLCTLALKLQMIGFRRAQCSCQTVSSCGVLVYCHVSTCNKCDGRTQFGLSGLHIGHDHTSVHFLSEGQNLCHFGAEHPF